ncbi:MAG: phage head closure protein [Hominilimicola sp.]
MKKMINPGKFNKQIEIGIVTDGIKPETGRDEGRSFEPIRTVWAGVSHVKSTERFQAAAVGAEKTVTFTFRYQPDLVITEDNSIKYNGLIYDIKSVSDPLEAHETLIVTGEAV